MIDIFNECKGRFVYNPLSKSINFSDRKATDYKLNRNVKLPEPMSSELEFDCEVRRREYMKQFSIYDQNKKRKKYMMFNKSSKCSDEDKKEKKKDCPTAKRKRRNAQLTSLVLKLKLWNLYIKESEQGK